MYGRSSKSFFARAFKILNECHEASAFRRTPDEGFYKSKKPSHLFDSILPVQATHTVPQISKDQMSVASKGFA
jgi:hypothetical protein